MTVEIHNCKTNEARLMSFKAAFNFWLKQCGGDFYPKDELEITRAKFKADVSGSHGIAYYPYTISKVYEGPLINPLPDSRHFN